MINSSTLLADLKGQLKLLKADLKQRAEDPSNSWGVRLKEEYAEAFRRERTGWSWEKWRDNEVEQAAVAWIISTTFLRFCEDNDLLVGAKIDGLPTAVGWIAGPSDRVQRAEENLTAYFRDNPTHNRRHWLQHGLAVLAAQPAGAPLVDPKHNPVWRAEITPETATALIAFWRRTNDDGTLVHDFTDSNLETRFLGDLYQDLSEHARDTYALLQTPVFVEEFILDQTLTPALAEFGLEEIKLIDPSCGSGHFLLGAFERLNRAWLETAPGLDAKERVRRAMASIHGVDINRFAIAIARFRLTVAGLKATGERSLVGVPAIGFHLAIGDSLLGVRGGLDQTFDFDDEAGAAFTYDTEDLNEYFGILQPSQYHVVVGNPPYITVRDPALGVLYRAMYRTAHREFQLTAPFMELMFRLAIRGEQGRGAGYVGQLTGNGFMKQEFGRKVIEDLFGGRYYDNPVDLTEILDTAFAHFPGHGTPTVIIFGRRRGPVSGTVRTVVGLRGEPKTPRDPAAAPYWSELVANHERPGFEGAYVAVVELDRAVLASFPWHLVSPVRGSVFRSMEEAASGTLATTVETFGYTGQTNADSAFLARRRALLRRGVEKDFVKQFVTGEDVRDYVVSPSSFCVFPYRDGQLITPAPGSGLLSWLWPLRTSTWTRATFSKKTYREDGRQWWEWHQVSLGRIGRWAITYPMVATLQHFALVRSGPVFNRHASFLQLPAEASEEDHLSLLGLLNSSTACFWLKQVCHNKGRPSADGAGADEPWEHRYEFTGTKLQTFPLPTSLPLARGRILDSLAQELVSIAPASVLADWSASPTANLRDALVSAEVEWRRLRERMIFEQEELDWEVYRLYGLIGDDLNYYGLRIDGISSSERAFAIALAQDVRDGRAETSWFRHWNHKYPEVADLPDSWPHDYKVVVQSRLELMGSDRAIRLLEKSEFKRRWATTGWDTQRTEALQDSILDRLEDPALWQDPQGPTARSVAELADLLRADPVLKELARALSGTAEQDLSAVIGGLIPREAVPFLAAHRYKAAGIEKYRAWQRVWALQRREDAGEKVAIPVPQKYAQGDFAKATYWKARGKLDVPKERFIAYPGLAREGDPTPVLGWAGWSHRDQALALAREIPVQQALGADDGALVPLVAGLVELEPWLAQWHSEIEPQFGASPASVITGVVDQYLARMEKTRDQVTAWTAPAATRGRRASR
ncbi:MAG: BREX-2 system adenine-specific DNA-methyltransferase PglX [Mycolicibacterium sp.]|uniref:BREX-2 system adenine-specific DNA-methyltransferase PglX n=1 Tax=Mycolicibacterium sp. TaxID=2320850 RepID=UPI003D0F8483